MWLYWYRIVSLRKNNRMYRIVWDEKVCNTTIYKFIQWNPDVSKLTGPGKNIELWRLRDTENSNQMCLPVSHIVTYCGPHFSRVPPLNTGAILTRVPAKFWSQNSFVRTPSAGRVHRGFDVRRLMRANRCDMLAPRRRKQQKNLKYALMSYCRVSSKSS